MEAIKSKQSETFKVAGNWEEQSKQLKKKHSKLTDADLRFETGKEEEMLKRVGNRLGKKRDEVISIIQKSQSEKD